ncbi:hypothetical protein BU17DRAFT_88445 [Hysterangium stoloniferum]|nr:hypothetical protein BU17DRAFT_88445 [Hysterangium stoloniferum]
MQMREGDILMVEVGTTVAAVLILGAQLAVVAAALPTQADENQHRFLHPRQNLPKSPPLSLLLIREFRISFYDIHQTSVTSDILCVRVLHREEGLSVIKDWLRLSKVPGQEFILSSDIRLRAAKAMKSSLFS